MKVSDANKQLQGLRSRASGESFERLITNACEYYQQLNLAFVQKTPEPMIPLKAYGDRRRGQFIACFTKCAQPDYKGILCDGSSIMFEAKHTDNDRINQSVITETQWKSLDIYEKFGAHCYVIVSIRLQSFYRVPWDVWKRMKELFGHKYMNKSELKPYKLQERQCTILILEGVELKNEYTENRAGTEIEQN